MTAEVLSSSLLLGAIGLMVSIVLTMLHTMRDDNLYSLLERSCSTSGTPMKLQRMYLCLDILSLF